MKKAIFPGSFDPITLGHYDIICRATELFDEIVVAVGENADKRYMFSVEERKAFIAKSFADNPKVKVVSYQGLTVDFCKKTTDLIHSQRLTKSCRLRVRTCYCTH